MLIGFSFISCVYVMHWIGFLFALKPFDYFAKQCKEMWFGHLTITASSIFSTVMVALNPYLTDSGGMLFVLGLNYFCLFCMTIGQICKIVYNFHEKQKMRRS